MHSRRRLAALAGALALTAAGGGAAASASVEPPLPHRNASYDTGIQIKTNGLQVTLVTAPEDPREIERTTSVLSVPIGTSGGLLSCPRARRESGFLEAPFVAFNFPGATLTLQGDGSYGFDRSWTFRHAVLIGSPDHGPFELDLTLTAEVVNRRLIVGTFRARGGACTSRGAIVYGAHRDRNNPPALPQVS
jgi:hypothetical protein